MLFVPLGGSDEIGASCHYLNIAGTGLLLDVGYHPEKDGPEGLPRFDLLSGRADRPVDHAVITHAHHDHMGSLPVLLQRMPHVFVHMTLPTRRLLEILLPASARLQRRRVMEGSTHHAPLFSREEVEAQSYVYHSYDLNEPFELIGHHSDTPVTLTFYHAGHVLGAVGVLFTFEEYGQTRRVFYTSDTNLRPQTIHPGAQYPDPPIDVLIMESTMGGDPNAELNARKDQEKALGEAIERTLTRGGSTLIPVFALGRAQEVIALIDRYKQRGIIPDDIPVYTAGSMRGIADIYDKTRLASPRLDTDFEVFGVEQKRLPRNQDRVMETLQKPGIHVAASGMMFERTLSNRLARRMIENPRHGIFFVGFLKEGSPGDRLLNAVTNGVGTDVQLDARFPVQSVHCEVDRFRLSGHSHRRDLIQLVEKMKPKKVLLVHGEPPARTWMADNIRFFYPDIEVILPQQGIPLTL